MEPSPSLKWVKMLKLSTKTSLLFWLICNWVLTALLFSKRPQTNTDSDLESEQEVIEISSDEESKDGVTREGTGNKSPKKRTLSNSATGSESPSKRRITFNTAFEILDSDDEHLKTMTAVPSPTKAATASGFSDTRPVKIESGAEKITSFSNEAAKDKHGRYIVTQKVKVDSIESLQEVPLCWPIPPEGTNTAYVIDLKNDKKWQELDANGKKKQLDRFIKQEVCPTYFLFAETANRTEQTLLF